MERFLTLRTYKQPVSISNTSFYVQMQMVSSKPFRSILRSQTKTSDHTISWLVMAILQVHLQVYSIVCSLYNLKTCSLIREFVAKLLHFITSFVGNPLMSTYTFHPDFGNFRFHHDFAWKQDIQQYSPHFRACTSFPLALFGSLLQSTSTFIMHLLWTFLLFGLTSALLVDSPFRKQYSHIKLEIGHALFCRGAMI